jgi:hypothetical protein
LERDLLRRELEAAQAREHAVLAREQEARDDRHATREREALLLRMVEQMQQRYDRLLDLPRATPPVPTQEGPQELPGRMQVSDYSRTPPASRTPGEDPRGAMRRRIVALLQEHPAGLTPSEIRDLLGVERSLTDTCLGMLRYGLVRRVGRGRYVVATIPDVRASGVA